MHVANSNTQSYLDDCECDFTSSDEISLRLRAKGLHYEVPEATTFEQN